MCRAARTPAIRPGAGADPERRGRELGRQRGHAVQDPDAGEHQRGRDAEDRHQHALGLVAARQVRHETAVDLQEIEIEADELRQPAVAAAEVVERHEVVIVGTRNLPASVPLHASELYAAMPVYHSSVIRSVRLTKRTLRGTKPTVNVVSAAVPPSRQAARPTRSP